MSGGATVELYWLPLGAGGHSVRFNGLAFEAMAAFMQHRPRRDLYHSALRVVLDDDEYFIEMAPVWNESTPDRGVVVEGSVGSRRLGRLRAFRYEIRRWRDGRLPDVAEAVDSPRVLDTSRERAQRILDLTPSVPAAVWGRDELHAGEMWNSNSVISWLVSSAGIDTAQLHPPRGGRAPGWDAGLTVAQRAFTRVSLATEGSPAGPYEHASPRVHVSQGDAGRAAAHHRPPAAAHPPSRPDRALEQSELSRAGDGLGAAAASELRVDVARVGLDRVQRDEQLGTDLAQ